MVSTSRCIYTCPVSSGMRLRHKWFERSDLNQSRKHWSGLFTNHDWIAVRPERTHEVSRCKQAQRECAGKGSLLSLPQSTCALSQAQQSFTSLINHMNRSNTALAGQKFVLAAAKIFSMQEKPCNENCIAFNGNCNSACWSLLVIGH